MQIKLKREWLGRKPGEVLNIHEPIATRLINWGTAEAHFPEKQETKATKAAPKDKMVKGAAKDKGT